jgi:hypothetical protein
MRTALYEIATTVPNSASSIEIFIRELRWLNLATIAAVQMYR